MKSKMLFGLMLLNITTFSFAQIDQRVTTLDASAGNGGVDIGLSHLEKIGGPVDLSVGWKAGMDVVNSDKIAGQLSGSAGLNFNVSEVFRINPLALYKCEAILTSGASQADKDKVNGCGFRAGGQLFLGERDKFNLGAGYTKSLSEKDHGEGHEFQFIMRVPLSANDVERSINEKGDMDFRDSNSDERKTSPGVEMT